MSFRLSTSAVLLTYSQTNELTKEDVLYTLLERLPAFLYAIGSESHQDGGRHIHAVLKFEKKFDTRDQSIFDINDGTTVHHPNIQSIKRGAANFDRAHTYVEKEDPTPLCTLPHRLSWGEILQHASNGQEYLELVEKNYPKEFQRDLQRFQYFANYRFGKCPNTIPEGWDASYDHTVPGQLELLEDETRFTKTLVIVGPAGCGKTTWAKSNAPKPALFIRHLDSLAHFRPEHRSIIFDDLDFRHLPPSTQKYLVDYENLAEIHCRYKVAKIPEGIPRIVTANEYPFLEEGVHAEAINRRVNKIFL